MNLQEIASKLSITFEEKPVVISGGNSYVVKAINAEGISVAVKVYKGAKLRKTRMLSREQRAISFLASGGILNIPQLMYSDTDLGLIAYKWIEGANPRSDSRTMKAIISMLQSLDVVFQKEFNFERAVDAAFSSSDVELQIHSRLLEIQDLGYSPILVWINAEIVKRLERYKRRFPSSQMFDRHTLSVSDLGTHNMLFDESKYIFIDFEFFGVDSVEKLVGDFILHPRNQFSESEISTFLDHAESEFGLKMAVLVQVLSILSLKWSLIALKREAFQFKESKFDIGLDLHVQEFNFYRYLAYFDYMMSNTSPTQPFTFFKFVSSLG